ncbi:MAG: hypothetical protein LBV31_00200, partial [Prevotellaceae bacterium]|nr:hypothetical protein [Prevotellaceae bacterium]
MEQTKSKIFLLLFLSNFCFFSGLKVNACGYSEYPWESQMMMFRAQLPSMQPLQMFYYTMDLYYDNHPDPQQNDRFRNCVEWQNQLDKSVLQEDVYAILYKTDPALFIEAFNTNTLTEAFSENSFVKQLLRSKNKQLMNYLFLAKQVEKTEEYILSNRFETWEWKSGMYDEYATACISQKDNCYLTATENLKTAKTTFLQERYAYQVCRLGYQVKQYHNVEETYNKYFKQLNPKSLMNVWSLFFKALSIDALGQKQVANILYAQVFDNCDEKKFRCIQMFNFDEKVPADIEAYQQSVMYAMKIINYPGRALDDLNTIYRLNKKSEYLPFLLMREINKLEDWILTPEYYQSNYPTYAINSNESCLYPQDEQIIENRLLDMIYLRKLKDFLQELQRSASTQDNKDFYNLALAHLSLMEENEKETKEYLAAIGANANPSILLQKGLESVWLAMNTQDITQHAFKELFVKYAAVLQHITVENFDNNKMLYSLTLKLSKEYLKKKDIVTANLLQMKSEQFGTLSNFDTSSGDYYYYYHRSGYQQLFIFDYNASVADIDLLIALLQNNKKTAFETFLCDQALGSVDAYKDLKGTIAFRANDLQTAYETFASMPQDFWETTYSYKHYLNEDPFVPKGLNGEDKRDFSYRFNKTDFVKTLIDLETSAAKDTKLQAKNYLQLGNALFNCSYWGNAWMMSSYGQSAVEIEYGEPECDYLWTKTNYYTCDVAASYYQKALQATAATTEQKAFATLMLFRCHWLKSAYAQTSEEESAQARRYAQSFYST